MRPVVLCILDGWGLSPRAKATPSRRRTRRTSTGSGPTCPHAQLAAHGPDVGLPEGQMGNSEVGHMNIGAGRDRLDGPAAHRPRHRDRRASPPTRACRPSSRRSRPSGGTAHLVGLASPGGVHAHQRHIAAAPRRSPPTGVPVAVHAFLDGRDVPPQTAAAQIADLEAALPAGARIATVSGRFYAMDRDKRWERVELAADGDPARRRRPRAGRRRRRSPPPTPAARPTSSSPRRVIGAYAGARDGDGLFFANFRADRAREILGALVDPDFDGFVVRRPRRTGRRVLGMVEYSDRLERLDAGDVPLRRTSPTPLGAWVAGKGLTQFRLAETEKYPHVTFFLNGGVEAPGRRARPATWRPSPKVRTYDLQPEMSAAEVTEHLVEAIRSGAYDLIVVNYANPDMVGHTGDLGAAIKAVEAVDRGLGAVLAALARRGRRDDRHRRPRQLRDDDRPGDRRAAHRAHPEPGAGDPGRRPAGRAPAATAGSPTSRPTLLDLHGRRPAARDDRTEPDRGPMRRLAARVLVALTLAGPLAATSAGPAERLGAPRRARLSEARAALAAASRLTDDRIAALAAARRRVGGRRSTALRDGVISAEAARARTRRSTSQRRRPEITRLAARDASRSVAPAEPAAALHPQGPLGAARARR